MSGYEKKYYVQDTRSTVGNSVLWWCHQGNGYTVDIRRAGVFNEEEARAICDNGRGADKMWPVEQVNRIIQLHVDIQDLRPKKKDGKMRKQTHVMKDWKVKE